MEVIMKILQVILALAILIIVHESGHFIFARLFKIRVEKFYLFFDMGGKALFRFKPKNSETEYGIGWLPLGGYCKISGMVDESMDTDYLKNEPQPWEFRSKPAWQRFLTMGGGILFNFILAALIYTGILAGWGDSYVQNEGNSIYVNELAYEMGFRTGDRILMFDDYVPEDFSMLQADMARHTARKATVLRGTDTVDIYIDQSMIGKVLNTPGMFGLAMPFVIDDIPENSVNHGSGLMKGDRILSIDGTAVTFVQDSRPLLAELSGKNVAVTIERGTDTLAMNLQVDTSGRFGVFTRIPGLTKKEYTVFSAIPAGFRQTFSSIGDYVQDIRLVATPSTEAYKSVGSFISIGQIFPGSWNWYGFLNILAMLSVMLGVMNLLPIPALDGGHMAFTLYEMITGRKPSDRFMITMQIIGFIILMGIIMLAFGNDIARLVR